MIFGKLYDKVMAWSRHPHAPRYLAVVSFAESTFFPIPVALMLAPMTLARPSQAWWLASITLVMSVLGGVFGYLLGYFFFELVEPWLHKVGYWDGYLKANDWLQEWGFWAILVVSFSPIPYKLATISAGVLTMSFLPFLIASIIGRGAQFFLVAGLMRLGGEKLADKMRKYIEWIGWVVILVAVVAYLIFNSNH